MNRVVTKISDIATGVLTKHQDAEGPHFAGNVAGVVSADITTAFTAKTGRAPALGDHVMFYDTVGTVYHMMVFNATIWVGATPAAGILTANPDNQGCHYVGDVAGTTGADITTAFTALTGRAPAEGDHATFYDTVGTAFHFYVYETATWNALV